MDHSGLILAFPAEGTGLLTCELLEGLKARLRGNISLKRQVITQAPRFHSHVITVFCSRNYETPSNLDHEVSTDVNTFLT